MKKIIIFLITFFLFTKANALDFDVSYNILYHGKMDDLECNIMPKYVEVDGIPLISLEPAEGLSNPLTIAEDSSILSKYSKEQLEYLRKLYYFGYYTNDSTYLNSMAMQELIWEYIYNKDVYYMNSSNEKINLEDYKNKILNYINKMDLYPDFKTINIKMKKDEIVELIDSNNILDEYEIINNSNNVVEKNGNVLYIKLLEPKNFTINFKRILKNNVLDKTYLVSNKAKFMSLAMDKTLESKIEIEYIEEEKNNQESSDDIISKNEKEELVINFDNDDYSYELIGKENKEELNQENALDLPYGNYTVNVKEDDKVFYKFDIDYTKDNNEFSFELKNMEQKINFVMPKTGN